MVTILRISMPLKITLIQKCDKTMKELLDKVLDTINNHVTYHTWYTYGEVEEYEKYVSFEVYGYSDQGEGMEWIEYWSIDSDGKIYTEDTTYNSFEDFAKEWMGFN